MAAYFPESSQELTPTRERNWLRERMDSDEIDLLALWSTLWRRKWGILSLVVIVMMLTTLVVYSMTPIYRATATLLFEQQGGRVLSIEQIYRMEGGGQEFMLTQVELLQSRGLAERIVRQLNLHQHYEFDPAQQQLSRLDPRALLGELRAWVVDFDLGRLVPGMLPEDLEETPEQVRTEEEIIERVARNLQSRITVELVRRSSLVRISVDMADRFTAAQVANALATGFIENQMEARMDMSLSATNWMSDRLGDLRDSLRLAEGALQTFRDENDLVDVSGIITVSANELSAISDRMINARRARAEAESAFRQVQQMRNQGWERLASVPAVLGDSLVQNFKREEARAQARVDELSGRYGPRHPTMQAAQSDLTSARVSLQTQVEQVVASIEQNYNLAVANERALQSAVERNRTQIQDLSRQEFRLRELQREVDTQRSLYNTFLTRLQETSATVDLETSNARVVDRATVPESPVRPRKQMIILLSGILAGMGGSGLVLLLVALNNTFRGTEEIEEKLNLPVLGVVPQLNKQTRHDMVNMFIANADKSFSESIRTIRTGVMLSGVGKRQKILLVTSSVPGEGKSTVATNLAFALSHMENVLLIESDMRRPGLSKAMEFTPGTPGLANLIVGTVGFAEATHRVEDLDVIIAGMVPPNPLELLSTQRFADILAELSEQYDRIVIDSPPVQAVSDALVLAQLANAVLYVIKGDSTPRAAAIRGVGQLLQSGAPLTGVILNQIDVKRAQKQGYSYGGYYDYYGYSSGAQATGEGKGSA